MQVFEKTGRFVLGLGVLLTPWDTFADIVPVKPSVSFGLQNCSAMRVFQHPVTGEELRFGASLSDASSESSTSQSNAEKLPTDYRVTAQVGNSHIGVTVASDGVVSFAVPLVSSSAYSVVKAFFASLERTSIVLSNELKEAHLVAISPRLDPRTTLAQFPALEDFLVQAPGVFVFLRNDEEASCVFVNQPNQRPLPEGTSYLLRTFGSTFVGNGADRGGGGQTKEKLDSGFSGDRSDPASAGGCKFMSMTPQSSLPPLSLFLWMALLSFGLWRLRKS